MHACYPQATAGAATRDRYIGDMSRLEQALAGAGRVAPARQDAAAQALLVAGAGGALGAAVVEQALADMRFTRVAALVEQPLTAAPSRLRGVRADTLEAGVADTAVVVFDRARGRHGRDDVFARAAPQALPGLARALHAAGVRRLVVTMPHAPAMLPQALRGALASLDEAAVAALGFEQFVVVRSAQRPGATGGGVPWLQRVADALLAQLHWMVPLREQPVRAEKVAALVLAIARALPQAAPGTRIAPPELVWQAAQPGDVDALARRWLADGEVPRGPAPRQRW